MAGEGERRPLIDSVLSISESAFWRKTEVSEDTEQKLK